MRVEFTLTWKKAAAALLLAILAALLVSWLGMVSISAASGHFSPVRWFLDWTMENAVSRQSLLVETSPDIDVSDPALARRAAGLYATGCSPCHGAPGVPRSPVLTGMTPAPPRLDERIGDWDDKELFWIVRNGIKYSGMPAWPALERDDEVWAQVAFLRALPGMNAETYAEIALGGDSVEGTLGSLGGGMVESALADCARCHGRDGLAVASALLKVPSRPSLASRRRISTRRCSPFATGCAGADSWSRPPAATIPRSSGRWPPTMPTSRARPKQGRRARIRLRPRGWCGLPSGRTRPAGSKATGPCSAATYRPAVGGPPHTRSGLLELGRRIAFEGLPARKVPSCESCQSAGPRGAIYPYLAGQPEWYISEHLELWRDGQRGGTAFS